MAFSLGNTVHIQNVFLYASDVQRLIWEQTLNTKECYVGTALEHRNE